MGIKHKNRITMIIIRIITRIMVIVTMIMLSPWFLWARQP